MGLKGDIIGFLLKCTASGWWSHNETGYSRLRRTELSPVPKETLDAQYFETFSIICVICWFYCCCALNSALTTITFSHSIVLGTAYPPTCQLEPHWSIISEEESVGCPVVKAITRAPGCSWASDMPSWFHRWSTRLMLMAAMQSSWRGKAGSTTPQTVGPCPFSLSYYCCRRERQHQYLFIGATEGSYAVP